MSCVLPGGGLGPLLLWKEKEQVGGGRYHPWESHSQDPHLQASPPVSRPSDPNLPKVRKEAKEMLREAEHFLPSHLSRSPLEWQGKGSLMKGA